jgi:hypothetical protein
MSCSTVFVGDDLETLERREGRREDDGEGNITGRRPSLLPEKGVASGAGHWLCPEQWRS